MRLTDRQIEILFLEDDFCPQCNAFTEGQCKIDAPQNCPKCGWTGSVRDLVEHALKRAGMVVRRGTEAEYDVLAERAKQRSRWSDEYDDTEHIDGMLAGAGVVIWEAAETHPDNPDWVNHAIEKHAENPRQRLVIAAALLIAEIDRLDRAKVTT